jgi:uncharacterized protein (DUF302 family)
MERQFQMTYGMTKSVNRPFTEVVSEVREALAAQGFGVLTEIDIKTTLKNKIDVDVEDQVILGACSPHHAHRALQADPSIGLLLPCNVVVRSEGPTTHVEAINPQMMVELSDANEMKAVADEVSAKLQAALDSLK